MRIKITELRTATEHLLSYLEEVKGETIEIGEDYYWWIPREAVYDPLETPDAGRLTLGQLSHDIQEVQRVASGHRDLTGYELVWLSSILRYLGERVH